MIKRALAGSLLVVLAVGLLGCTTPAPSPTGRAAVTSGDGVVRTDAGPIVKRYPALAAAQSMHWVGGTTGTSDVGPSTYRVDVIAVLPAATIDSLREKGDLHAVDRPKLVAGLTEHVPPGPFEGSETLNGLFANGGRTASVAIDVAARTIVLTGTFE